MEEDWFLWWKEICCFSGFHSWKRNHNPFAYWDYCEWCLIEDFTGKSA